MKKIFAFLATLICCLSMWSFVPAAQSLTLDKEDGEYSIQVDLEGGSGKASVTTPTLITVKDGSVTAKIQWSSSNYDYMIVDGEKYLPVNEEGAYSEFEIPVTALDEGMPVMQIPLQWAHLMRLIIRLHSTQNPLVPKARCHRKPLRELLRLLL